MAMKRKASSTRKPPEPSESHAEIDDWMRRVMPDLNPIVTRLDELIRERCAFGPAVRRQVEEGVLRAARRRMDDGDGRLRRLRERRVLRGRRLRPATAARRCRWTRYIKLRTMDEVEQPELKSWIEQAGRVPGWKEERSAHGGADGSG